MTEGIWGIGVDLGGTKIEAARIDIIDGRILQRSRYPTRVGAGASAIISDIIDAVNELEADHAGAPVALGVGVAGQIEAGNGTVLSSPNLGWRNVPLQAQLQERIETPVIIHNDVHAATWGEYRHGAGQGYNNLLCLFVGTGIGGGIISNGRLLTGCSNTAGELGHIPVDLHGPCCHCGNNGCLEALAGGWAIARQAQKAVMNQPQAGAALLDRASGNRESITARIVAQAAHAGDPLANEIIDDVTQALVAGVTGLVNAFNPCRIILGGGVIEGLPGLIAQVNDGVKRRALAAATASLQVVPAQLHNDAGVIGAAALAVKLL